MLNSQNVQMPQIFTFHQLISSVFYPELNSSTGSENKYLDNIFNKNKKKHDFFITQHLQEHWT